MASFDEVWQRIVTLRGEIFYQKRGQPFTYAVSGNSLKPSTTNRQLPRSHFARAFARAPLDGPGQLQDLQGPSYLFAILTDRRVTADRSRATASRAGVMPGNDGRASNGRPAGGTLTQATGTTARPGTPAPATASAVRLPAPGALRQIDPRRALLVVPCSAAKTRGGQPPGDAAQQRWPEGLRTARGRVLAAAEGDMARQLPAWRRYDGMFYRYAGTALAEAVETGNVVIISGGYGVARAQELIGWYDKVLRLADWPAGLLESVLTGEAHRAGSHTVVAFASATTGYAQLLRRTRWRDAGLSAYLVTITGVTSGAMAEVPRRLGLGFCAFCNHQHDSYPPGTIAEQLS